jgi:GNAT superfamily N-acetyltransferase
MMQLSEVAHATAEFYLDLTEKVFRRMARTPEVYLNLVAVVEGQIAGFISVVFYQTFFHGGGTALINELIVSREQRGGGIGRALVQWVRDEAIARGMDEVEVSTEADNALAQQFYRKCGFDGECVLLGMDLAPSSTGTLPMQGTASARRRSPLGGSLPVEDPRWGVGRRMKNRRAGLEALAGLVVSRRSPPGGGRNRLTLKGASHSL